MIKIKITSLGKVLVIAIPMLLLIWFISSKNQANQLGVETQLLMSEITIGDIENIVPAVGSIRPIQIVEVGAQVSGQLVALRVKAGDKVSKGDLLAEIDATQQRSRVDASRASLAGLEAQLASSRSNLGLAELNTERQRYLMAAEAASQLDYDTSINTLSSAVASLTQLERQIDQSRASLAIEERELEFTQVIAPIDGTVMSIAMSEGRTLNASQQSPTILTLADLSVMEVQPEISEADVGQLQSGMEVYFTTLGAGNRRWTSTLKRILPQPSVINNVVLYIGLFDIDNSDGTLLPEMTAQVYFVQSAVRGVTIVPLGALTFSDQMERLDNRTNQIRNRDNQDLRLRERRASTQVQLSDGIYETREVIIGLTSRTHAEVISGLEIGERVVSGNLRSGIEGVDRQVIREAMGIGRR